MKALLIVILLAILGALASAGVFMLGSRKPTQDGPDRRMARALALRVGLSVTLFLIILLGWWMGWLKPTGIPTGY